MSIAEKMHARKHYHELAYAEMYKYYKDYPVPKLTPEQENRVKEYLCEKLKEAGFNINYI